MSDANYEVTKGVTAKIMLTTRDDNGVVVAPDAAPAITGAWKDGVAIATAGMAIAQAQDSTPANITGVYFLSIPTAAYAATTQITVRYSVTINGFTSFGEKTILVSSSAKALPSIS